MQKTKTDQMIFVFLNFIFVLATFLLLYYRFAEELHKISRALSYERGIFYSSLLL